MTSRTSTTRRATAAIAALQVEEAAVQAAAREDGRLRTQWQLMVPHKRGAEALLKFGAQRGADADCGPADCAEDQLDHPGPSPRCSCLPP